MISPDHGFLKRRALAIRAAGIISRGPDGPPEPPPLPPIEQGMLQSAPHLAEHHAVIEREISAIDRRREQVAQFLAAHAAGASSHKCGELRTELAQLRLIREEISRDLRGYPAARTDAEREYVRSRAQSLREQLWGSADRLSASGEYRHARRSRIDSLRARHLAEHEVGLRQHLSGY